MIKLQTLIKQPLNDCVIARLNFDGNIVLAKNRDRMYAPELEVVHELVNGVEVVYMHDILTDWSEGMNSNGIGLGLVISQQITHQFDGNITVQSELGEGSAFTFYFKLQ